MLENIMVCVLVGFSFLCLFIYMFECVYCYMLYVCLHVCACSYATCMWPEFNMQ